MLNYTPTHTLLLWESGRQLSLSKTLTRTQIHTLPCLEHHSNSQHSSLRLSFMQILSTHAHTRILLLVYCRLIRLNVAAGSRFPILIPVRPTCRYEECVLPSLCVWVSVCKKGFSSSTSRHCQRPNVMTPPPTGSIVVAVAAGGEAQRHVTAARRCRHFSCPAGLVKCIMSA